MDKLVTIIVPILVIVVKSVIQVSSIASSSYRYGDVAKGIQDLAVSACSHNNRVTVSKRWIFERQIGRIGVAEGLARRLSITAKPNKLNLILVGSPADRTAGAEDRLHKGGVGGQGDGAW